MAGRPRRYDSAADRQAAYRARRAEEARLQARLVDVLRRAAASRATLLLLDVEGAFAHESGPLAGLCDMLEGAVSRWEEAVYG